MLCEFSIYNFYMICRHCGTDLDLTMVDLGTCPPSNSYLPPEKLDAPEKWYPLRVMVCRKCWLAQTVDFVEREECFSSTYAYFSSCSTSWVEHAERYAVSMIGRFGLGARSRVLEVAANDGYLLQHFVRRNIPCYGIEPTESTAAVAREKGIELIGNRFWPFGALARSLKLEALISMPGCCQMGL